MASSSDWSAAIGATLKLLRRHRVMLTITTALGLLLGVAANVLTAPVYEAQAKVFVSVLNAPTRGMYSALQADQYVRGRLRTYAQLVTSPTVLDQVARDLVLPGGTASLGGINAEVDPETVVLKVSATHGDPALAAAIANATARAVESAISRLDVGSRVSVRAKVTSPAQVPVSPVQPRGMLNLVLGLILGFGVGVCIALLRGALDRTLRSAGDVETTAAAPLLGSVPTTPELHRLPLLLDGPLVDGQDRPARAAMAELATNLQFISPTEPPRVLALTSAIAGEGKTTITANLAVSLATGGARVLVVEADLRRPRLADCFEIAGDAGLTDVLIGSRRFDEVVVGWNRGRLDVLPSGPIPPNPAELLGSARMTELLASLRSSYDWVLLDGAPVLPVIDGAILASQAEATILVVRLGHTHREDVARAAQQLRHVGVRELAVVANCATSAPAGLGAGLPRSAQRGSAPSSATRG